MPLAPAINACIALLSVACITNVQAQSSSDRPVCFDAQDLAAVEQSKRLNLIYVWSPRMVLSASQAADVRSQAIRLKFDWIVVHDHRVANLEVEQALQTLQASQPLSAQALLGSRPLCAAALLQRDAYLHFPVAFVANGGVLHNSKIIGAMPSAFWHTALTERLNALRADLAPSLHAD